MSKLGSNDWASKTRPKISDNLIFSALAVSSDIIILTDNSGVIEDLLVDATNAAIGRLDHWVGRNIKEVVQEESVPKITRALADVLKPTTTEAVVTEVNHFDGNEWEFPIRYTCVYDTQTEQVLFSGTDLGPVARTQQALVETQLELERDYESSRDFETRYRAILEMAGVPFVLVNISTGNIEDTNSMAADMLGESPDTLRGSDFLGRFEPKDNPKSLDAIVSGASGKPATDWQATVQVSRKRVSVVTTPLRSAGTRYALCRFDVKQTNTGQSDLLSDGLRMLFEDGVDAIVFTDRAGVILHCNNSFLDLCDASAAGDVINRPLADFMARGSIDQKMLIEGGSKNGQLRSYNTKVLTNYRSTLPVNVSATLLSDRTGGGFGFVIRIMRSVEAVSFPDAPYVLNANQNFAKLVGASPLKDIVAGTADVIERICIETAIDVTGNNRVAAAEMLGLSRQSLYVKLRKYNMV